MSNKKGFISTTTIYCLLIVFLLMLMVLLLLYNNSRMLLSEYKSNLKEELVNNNTYTDDTLLSNLILLGEGDFSTVIAAKTYIASKDAPSFSSVATTDEGLYAINDDYGTSYYYRGAVNDNWVYFAGFYWRIIRIDGEGNIKLIYSGDAEPTTSSSVIMTGTSTQLEEKNVFNALSSSTYYAGYIYESNNFHGTSSDSTVKTALESWYDINIYFEGYSFYLEETTYCVDREAYSNATGSTSASSLTANHYYGAYIRLDTNKSPSLICSNDEDKLESYVGLISADEIVFAGGSVSTQNSSFYLYTGQPYWTLSSYYYYNSNAYVFILNANGKLNSRLVTNTSTGLRPTISLAYDTVVLEGSGTYDDPYIITEVLV